MKKRLVRSIINCIKFVIPKKAYLKYYSKKHDDLYKSLMKKVDACDDYIENPAVKEDYFNSLGEIGWPVSYYSQWGFYDFKDSKQRDSFVSPTRLVAISYGFNCGLSRKIFDDKISFMKKFSEYTNREWLDAYNASFAEFKGFCIKNPKMIAKNSKGFGGKGTHIFEYVGQSDEELKQIFSEYGKTHSIIEQYICQKGILHDLNPCTVNCVRVCTMRFKDHVEVFQCFVTTGSREDVCVDNAYEGGLFAPIDVESGVVLRDLEDGCWKEYPKHPVSGISIKGVKIPHWDKAKELALKVADNAKDLMYISCDIAISEDGSIYLIEGNTCGDGCWCKEYGEWDVYTRALDTWVKRLKYKIMYNCIIKYHIVEVMSYTPDEK